MTHLPTTNHILYTYHVEIQNLQKSVLGLLLRNKVQEFYKNNGLKIDLLSQGTLRIQKEHLVFENEQIKRNEDKTPVLIEGKTNEDLQKAYDELMQKETTIII